MHGLIGAILGFMIGFITIIFGLFLSQPGFFTKMIELIQPIHIYIIFIIFSIVAGLIVGYLTRFHLKNKLSKKILDIRAFTNPIVDAIVVIYGIFLGVMKDYMVIFILIVLLIWFVYRFLFILYFNKILGKEKKRIQIAQDALDKKCTIELLTELTGIPREKIESASPDS